MSIWQTHSWKKLLLASAQAESVFEVDGVFAEKRSLWLGQFWLFVLWISPEQKIKTEKFSSLAKNEKCLFVQFETLSYDQNPDFLEIQKGYYKKFITPYTALIDLELSQEEILAQMKPKGRYNIWLAQKKWVEVFEAEKSQENIKKFYNLMLETTSRDGFSGNTMEYYEKFLNIIPTSKLIFTKKDDEILSAGIFVFDEEVSIYYYGASTSKKEYRNLMAPYLMQWYAIEHAKSVGSHYYDFLWTASPGDNTSPLAWVTDFKLKFTPNQKFVSEGYILKISIVKLFLFQTIKNLKRLFF